VESQYAPMSFGIPVKSLQVNSDGDLKRAPHLKWLTLRKKTEHMVCDSNGTMKQIVVPSRMDVLFGRGTPLRSHVGNMRLTDLIDEDFDVRGMGMHTNMDNSRMSKSPPPQFLKGPTTGCTCLLWNLPSSMRCLTEAIPCLEQRYTIHCKDPFVCDEF
jgi:hypothetical protein